MFLNPFLITIFILETVAASQCCEQLSQLACIRCPQNMHLYRNNCIYNIPHCVQYLNGFDCTQCEINYQLINSECRHVRLLIDPQLVTNYTAYLHSGIKPNLLINQALEILGNNTVVWSDWLELVHQNHNESNSAKHESMKEASILQKRIMKGIKSLLYYIYTAQYVINGMVLNLFRFTYEVEDPPGFADIVVAIQHDKEEVEYLQIVQIRITELQGQGWQQLPINYQVKVERWLLELFPIIEEQLLVKGWWRPTESGYNFLLFELSDVLGVISYSYEARIQEVKNSEFNLTISQNNTHNDNKQINSTRSYDKGNETSKDHHHDQHSTQTKTNQSDSQAKNGTDNSNKTNTKDQIHGIIPKDAKSFQTIQQKQSYLEMSALLKNEVLMAGYAIAMKFNYVFQSALVEGASSFPFNSTYCLYFVENSTYYQLMYQLNISKPAFQVISFSSSKTSQLTVSNSTNNSQVINKEINASNSPQNNRNYTKSSNNPTSDQTKKSESTSSATETKSNNSTLNIYNQNLSTQCLQQRSTPIDITNQINEDAYMPKINLLLTKIYADSLLDSRIGEASYTWAVDVKTKVSSLTYNIKYITSLNQQYQFEVQIVNNQIKFTKTPSNIKESGTVLVSNNKTNANTSPHTANKTIQTNNQNINSSSVTENKEDEENKESKVFPVSGNKTDSFSEESLTNITEMQPITPESQSSSNQTNLISEQKKEQQNIDSNTKVDNDTAVTPQKINKNVSQSNRSVVSSLEYLQNPKYKPIVDIVCMIKRVPVNASLSKMEEWTVKEDNHYSIKIVMNFSTALNNGSIQKLFNFQVKVNANSYVTILSYNVSYCCIENNTNASTPNQSQPATIKKSPLLKSIGGVIQLSPYSSSLISTIRESSAGLNKMTVQMVSFSQTESYSGFGNCFVQKLRFKDSKKVLCYEINYCVSNTQGQSNMNQVYIRNYHVIGCNEKKENQFLYSLINAQFIEAQNYNQEFNAILTKVYNKREIAYNAYKQYSNFYLVSFNESLHSDISYLYDSTSLIVVSFYKNPAKQTPSSSKLFDQQHTQAINIQIQKTLGLKRGTFEIILIEESKLSDKIVLLSIYVAEKIEFWGAELTNLYFIEAQYQQNKSQIFILNHRRIVNDPPPMLQISHKMLAKMYQIPLISVKNNNKFAQIIQQTNLNYQSFMQTSHLQAVIISSELDYQHFLNNTLTNQTKIKIIVAKKSGKDNYSTYAITIFYDPFNNNTDFKGIELINSDVVKVANCKDNKHQLGLPTCAACSQGYKLIGGNCVAEINGCSQYYQFSCIGCTLGHISESLSSCQLIDFYESSIKIVNTYLLQILPDQQ